MSVRHESETVQRQHTW